MNHEPDFGTYVFGALVGLGMGAALLWLAVWMGGSMMEVAIGLTAIIAAILIMLVFSVLVVSLIERLRSRI